jgi:hypothetical protein
MVFTSFFQKKAKKKWPQLVTYPQEENDQICTYIYIYWGFYLFIIIKKRKGRLIKHVPFENCTAFFLILEFYDFLQLSERGSNEKQVAKKEKRTVPTSAGGQ